MSLAKKNEIKRRKVFPKKVFFSFLFFFFFFFFFFFRRLGGAKTMIGWTRIAGNDYSLFYSCLRDFWIKMGIKERKKERKEEKRQNLYKRRAKRRGKALSFL
eukprot:TRINITY_DN9203_c0_g1_i2.p1 TRINITY_DN9203_c0_g1~~TRINITY_DN9203_c0_g1_i2.p1  ORF type:complete len:102 (-),score=0.11 TRINITY_DN9203_c0_g1_i2:446-751(-)